MNTASKSLWQQKGIWLISLAIFFYATYNTANYITIWRAKTEIIPHIMFQWEHSIPLIPWTIIPYWTENLFYGLAILLAINFQQLNTLGKRLLTTQIICVIGFLSFPLQQINILNRPEVGGFFGWWFDSLMKFDHPYNQAPSLHISLLVVLWSFYSERLSRKWHWPINIWAILIGVSVLTTWQHHFIDIPSGILAGALAIWCFPILTSLNDCNCSYCLSPPVINTLVRFSRLREKHIGIAGNVVSDNTLFFIFNQKRIILFFDKI